MKAGDQVTFFYPSTEWDMDEQFTCWCGADECLKSIRGAKYLDDRAMKRYFFNDHILRMRQNK
jgi:hypothetical protein